VLDSLGCAIASLNAEPIKAIREHVIDFGGRPIAVVIGGGRSSPDHATLHNSGATRYLEFSDTYLAEQEGCHPSDNLGAVLAVAEYAELDGPELLTALAVAYQVQCRLGDIAPVRPHGFDHVTHGAYAAAAGAAKALGLDAERIAHAIAISGTAFNSLRVSRTGSLSHWKGLAYANTACGAVQAAFLARRGVTGPREVFEGSKGLMDTITGPFELDWRAENLERVLDTVIKKYLGEGHAQSTIEVLLELRERHPISPDAVDSVEVEVFDAAYQIAGGGEGGDKLDVHTREEADHSLPYMVAAALCDGALGAEQYEPERIARDDVQRLLRRVRVISTPEFSARFPDEHCCRVTVKLGDGSALSGEGQDYEGGRTQPASWEMITDKFRRVTAGRIDEDVSQELIAATASLDELRVAELASILERIEA
jgi:2-methylcitrate dehydratase